MSTEKQIKAVIFDLDDTLIDWSTAEMDWKTYNRPKIENIRRHFVERDFQMPPADAFADLFEEKVHHVWRVAKEDWAGPRLSDAMELALLAADVAADRIDLDEVMRVYDWTPFPGVRPYPDTHRVLTHLKRQGYKIGLITNAFHPMWMRDIELVAYDLLKYFDARITSGDTRFMKPHPAIYWRMLGMLDLMPEEAVYIGDRPLHDIGGAQAVDMIGILMAPAHLDREMEGIEPDYTIGTLTELLPILDELQGE